MTMTNTTSVRCARARELFVEHRQRIFRRTDRLFAGLMVCQWIAGIVVAQLLSPRTWTGSISQVHPHVWFAFGLGGAISLPPILLGILRPGETRTRYTIAICQMLTSSLLIHLSGGRIETHFHVFGSLAFLAFYRDWKVLIPATVIVAADHILRGMYFPESVYGVIVASQWRWLEHAGWVIFEDIFLIWSCRHSVQEMWSIAEQRAQLETTNAAIQASQAELSAAKVAAEAADQAKSVILNTALDAIVTIDSTGLISTWNVQAETVFGWSAAEAVGKRLEQTIIPERYREAHLKGIKTFQDTGEGALLNKRIEIVALKRDGQEFPVELSITPARSGSKSIFTAFIRDITERKRVDGELLHAKEAAETASRAKSEFLANMSHEIRTPLNGVIGMAHLLMRKQLNPQQMRCAEGIQGSAESLLSLVNDILDFSKIEAGKFELHAVEFELEELVEGVVEMLSPKAAEKRLEFGCYIQPQANLRFKGDHDRLRQILVNLVGNAIKFTERGEVVIRVELAADLGTTGTLCFTVRDTGIGIPADRRDRLFKSFSQVDASMSRKFGGTGLGLAITKQLVELMGGQIEFDSESGKGSTFRVTVTLPRCEAPAASRRAKIDLAGLRILAVDDNAAYREILQSQLTSWGFDVMTVPDAEKAIIALRGARQASQPFRVAILDLILPGINGKELAAFIKADPSLRETGLLMLTAMADSFDAGELKKSGFAQCLTKPMRQSQLFDAIMEVIAPADASAVAPVIPERPRRTRQAHVLLAEDNAINQTVASELLKDSGFTCDVVSDGKAAIQAVQRGNYDVVLMDCQMPEMNGFDATRLIRQLEEAGSLPGPRRLIIALTANAIAGDRDRCLDAGMDDYLSKPIDPDLMVQTIEKNLGLVRESASELPVEETPASCPPFELTSLLQRCRGKQKLVEQLLGTFSSVIPAQLTALDQSLASGDAAALMRLGHSIKGSAANLSAEGVRQSASNLEDQAKLGDLESVAEEVRRLKDQVRQCMEFIPTVVGSNAGESKIARGD